MTEMYQSQNSTRCDDYLDMEYLTTLRNIKPYITCIMNNHFIELIRVWLEKLSDTKVQNDKSLRNVYLVELGKQIISGVFVEPFVDPPEDGPLPPFKNSWKCKKDKISELMKRLILQNDSKVDIISLQNVGTQAITDAWTQSGSGNFCVQPMADSTKCSSQTTTDPRTHTDVGGEKSFRVQQRNASSPKNQLHDVREKLAMVREYSKEMCKGGKNAKKKKVIKCKKQLQRTLSDETDICRQNTNERRFEPPYKEVRVYSPLRKIKEGDRKFAETDDSSWFDLTDGSNYCSGDGDIPARMYEQDDTVQMQELYEKKIAELVHLIADLRQENAALRLHVEKCEISLKNSQANGSLHNLAHEVEALKKQLQELINIKLNLQNGHFGLSAEWQNTISTLHKKLSALQRKNNELKLENADLTKKLGEQETDKRKELNSQKKKLSEFHGKETDMLKQIHARAITDMESKYIQKMADQDDDFHKRLDDIKDNYENRFNNLKDDYDVRVSVLKEECEARMNSIAMDYEKVLANKDADIDRLEAMLQEQCARMQEEVQMIRSQIESNISSNNECNLEKIAFLQKCIVKMERLYQKAEKENQKQMVKLKRELDFRDKSNQLALSTQRADLLSHTANGKQNEIDIVVAELEEYYKNKLIEHQQRALEEKRQDNKLIAELKDQLAKLNNEY